MQLINTPKAFYCSRIEENQIKLANIKKRLFAFSMVRLFVFCLSVGGIYLAYGNTRLVVGIILVTIVVFLLLVAKYTDLQYERDKLRALIDINKTEIDVLNRNFHHLPNGNSYKDPHHYFSQDIDLFGRGSFYQYANRTALQQGSKMFAGLLTENSIENISEKQATIQELTAKPEWRQNFSAVASLTKTKVGTETILKWLSEYRPFVSRFMNVLPWLFSALSIGLFILYFMDLIPESILVIWWVFGLGITSIYGKKIKILGENASKIQSTFQQYNQLLAQIENTEFTSPWLHAKRQDILANAEKTSEVIKRFSKLLYNLDKGYNLVYLIFGNGFFLRTMSHCYQVEKWILKHGASVEKWFDTIAFFDAYNSLGNFAFNHPDYVFPTILEYGSTLKSKGAGHPLLDPKKSVLNDFEIKNDEFFIITGANMAGKSTFLRTVSLQIVMANIGLPVCATSVDYVPIKLITSMRTTDSLTDDESYFFSELKRLKFIIDEIQQDKYFIVLDEILKGTNSIDKAKGSRKFVERLVASKATGIIATHDLSLCDVAKELPQVKNHYFDAEIVNDELHFDYKFKEGICQNMNASFLLKKMAIVN